MLGLRGVTVQSKNRRIFPAFFEGQEFKQRKKRIEKAQKVTERRDFRAKQGFFGLNDYLNGAI